MTQKTARYAKINNFPTLFERGHTSPPLSHCTSCPPACPVVPQSDCRLSVGYLPHDFPPRDTVYYYFAKWRDGGMLDKMQSTLHQKVRVADGRESTPSACSRVCLVQTILYTKRRLLVKTNFEKFLERADQL